MNQITKFNLNELLREQLYFVPVFILFLQFHHLNFQEIFWVITIGSMVGFAMEIPTGVFADLFGKKRSIVLSKLGVFISFVIFGFSTSFWMFVVAQAVFELGRALRSGTEGAFIYDYIKQNPGIREMSFTELRGRQKFWQRAGESSAALMGGFIAVCFGFNAVFFFAAVPAFANLLLAVSWEDIKEKRTKRMTLGNSIAHARASIAELAGKRILVLLLVNATIFESSFVAMKSLVQPYMIENGVPLEWFGILFSVFILMAAFSTRYAHVIEKRMGSMNAISLLSFLMIIPPVVVGFGHPSMIGVILLLLVFVMHYMRMPISSSEFQSHLRQENKATMTSTQFMISKNVGNILILPVAGYMADAFSMQASMLLIALILVMNAVLFYMKK
jgi:MFS family permease